MKRTLSILLVIAIIAAFGMLATGCNNNNNNTNETTAATVAATQAASTAATTAPQGSTVTPTSAPASQATSSGGIEGLSQDDAINKAVQAKPGYYVNSIEKGTDSSGKEVWVVAMVNDDGNEITVYVSNSGVTDASGSSSGTNPTQAQSTQSSAGGESDTYAGRSRSAAVNDALASMTFECYVDSVSQGTDNFGRDAWIIILNGSDGNRYISYVSEEGVITNPYNG